MTTGVHLYTKLKILENARVLFADLGFEGTSIREIAKRAEVNVASINYHFTSKENLFAEIMRLTYNECSEAINSIFAEETVKLEDGLVGVFRYFLDHSHDILSYFKMMLSSQHAHYIITEEDNDGYYGPPGGQKVANAIIRESGRQLSEEDVHWALKTLFSHVTHISIIHNCCLRDEALVPFSGLEDLEGGIRRLTRVVLNELKISQG